MLYLTCTMISSVDLARNGVCVSRAKNWVSVDCGTSIFGRTQICELKYNTLQTLQSEKKFL